MGIFEPGPKDIMSNGGPKPPCPPRGGGPCAGNPIANRIKKLSVVFVVVTFSPCNLKNRRPPRHARPEETHPHPTRRRRIAHPRPSYPRKCPGARAQSVAVQYERHARTHRSPEVERRGPPQSRRSI